MTENTKTATFIGIALLLLIVAIVVRPKAPVAEQEQVVGKPLVEDLKNATMVHGLEIVTLDDAGDPKAFKVMRESGSWRLPSKEGYPADAERQMADAATSLIDVKILSVANSRASSHGQYGVVSPENDKADKESAGKLVKVLDRTGKAIASLIIGKEDKKGGDNFGSEQQIRFVRKEGGDAVYKVALPSEKFSPKFSDWIEVDLLKLEPWEITEVTLRDYNVFVGEDANTGRPVASLDHRGTIDLAFNDKDAKWSLKELTEYEQGKPHKVEVGENEELNTTKLNDLKTALDDLKIVDVQRKPAGLSGTLRATGEALKDPAAARSLATHGFFPVPKENDEFEIYSQDGEVLVRMKDGLEYLLRFGKAAGLAASDESPDDAAKKADTNDEAKEEESGTKLNRYIMVSARFNEDQIPKPQLEAVPGASSETKTDDAETESDKKSGDSEKEAESKTGDVSSEAKEVTTKKVVAEETSANSQGDEAKADDGAKKEDAAKNENTEDKDGQKKPSAEEQEAQALERKRIEKENERKQKEYDDKVKKGQAKAKELNDRFADWYYVVSDETYRKIHIGKSDVIKTKPVDEKKDSEEAKDELSLPSINDPFKRDATKSGEATKESEPSDDAKAAEQKESESANKAPASDKAAKGDSASPKEKAASKTPTKNAVPPEKATKDSKSKTPAGATK